MAGNPGLYAKLLLRFAKQQKGLTADIRQAVQNGDIAKARSPTHTLKGMVGNIGASSALPYILRTEE